MILEFENMKNKLKNGFILLHYQLTFHTIPPYKINHTFSHKYKQRTRTTQKTHYFTLVFPRCVLVVLQFCIVIPSFFLAFLSFPSVFRRFFLGLPKFFLCSNPIPQCFPAFLQFFLVCSLVFLKCFAGFPQFFLHFPICSWLFLVFPWLFLVCPCLCVGVSQFFLVFP